MEDIPIPDSFQACHGAKAVHDRLVHSREASYGAQQSLLPNLQCIPGSRQEVRVFPLEPISGRTACVDRDVFRLHTSTDGLLLVQFNDKHCSSVTHRAFCNMTKTKSRASSEL